MDALQAFWLGILQGITEFLPISSSAHLILVPEFLGWPDQGVTFDLAVHVGTLLAVVIYFRRDLADLVRDGLASIARRQIVGRGALAGYIIIATIPACVAGLLLLDLVENQLRSVAIICVTTLVFGLLLGWADWRPRADRNIDSISLRDAVLVGLAQAVSLIPGTSRSGITLTTGLLLGLSREAASRFSFLLAIPITALAAASKLGTVFTGETPVDVTLLVIGAVTSFITAITAIHFFLKWLNRFGLWPYVIYRVILAGVIYVVFLS